MAIAKILAKLGLNITEWQTNLTKAQQQANTFASANLMQIKNAVAGAFTVGAIIAFTKHAADAAEQTINVSRALGISTNAFQALSAAAKLSGGTQEDVISMLQKLRKAMGGAAEGSKEMRANFTNLGISLEGIGTADPAAVLEKIAKASQGAATDSQKFNDIIQILGRDSLPKMQEVLNELAEGGLTELEKKYRAVINSAEDLANLQNAKQQMEYAGQVAGKEGGGFLSRIIEGFRTMSQMPTHFTLEDVVSGKFREQTEQAGMKDYRYERAKRSSPEQKAAALTSSDKGAGFGGQNSEAFAKIREQAAKADEEKAKDEQAKRRDSAKRFEAMKRLQMADYNNYERVRRGEGISIGSPEAANSIARIGGTIGRQTDPMHGIAERAKKISDDLRAIRASIGKMANESSEVKDS